MTPRRSQDAESHLTGTDLNTPHLPIFWKLSSSFASYDVSEMENRVLDVAEYWTQKEQEHRWVAQARDPNLSHRKWNCLSRIFIGTVLLAELQIE